MENVQQTEYSERPVIRSVFKKFLENISEISTIDKIRTIYTYFTNVKPDVDTNGKVLLNRVLYEMEFGDKIKETDKMLKSKKQFKWPFKVNASMKKSKKARDMVLVFYLNIKGEMEDPKLYPLYTGNMVIIRNKPYEVDPRAFWNYKKYKCLLIKEIDRRPVSNLDYSEIRRRGDSTDSDELLIKATLKAMVAGAKKPMGKGAIAILIFLIVGVGIYLLSKGA